jgi:hypothetical protein
MKRRTLLLLSVAIVAVAAVAIVLASSSSTVHDQGAIRFGASLNATTIAQGQAVRVYLENWNTGDSRNSLPMGNGLQALNLTSGPCAGLYPAGIAVYQGAYDLSNFSSASALTIYPSGSLGCPAESITNSFTFEPLQNVTANTDLSGYFTSGSTPQVDGGATTGVLEPFSPGVYTVITGNAWGTTKVLYFHVSGTTGDQERTGPVSSFPASWLNPCNQSATGNVTTMTDLGLNASSDFDHINIDQVYAQIVNSSSFAFHSVGRGWVVAEWYEIQASPNSAGSDDQVIGYFILTSDGVPSGYIYAHYDLVSGNVAVAFTEATAASCPT